MHASVKCFLPHYKRESIYSLSLVDYQEKASFQIVLAKTVIEHCIEYSLYSIYHIHGALCIEYFQFTPPYLLACSLLLSASVSLLRCQAFSSSLLFSTVQFPTTYTKTKSQIKEKTDKVALTMPQPTLYITFTFHLLITTSFSNFNLPFIENLWSQYHSNTRCKAYYLKFLLQKYKASSYL